MAHIHLLDDSVINKIAAGEVVERPASVVKELVENAIDAGSTHIVIDLEEGGKKRIGITDNGVGISKEDIDLTILRHATSKISSADDLFDIHSMGFRGEALASISSVSRFSIASRHKDACEGIKLETEGGQGKTKTTWVGPVGTTIQVVDLFFNIPVREKFLKKPASEYASCLEYVHAVALAKPEVGFTLKHNDKEQFFASAIADQKISEVFYGEQILKKRFSRIFGEDVAAELIYFNYENQYGKIEALISPPGIDRPTSKNIFSFVNGRAVKDKTVHYGIMRGYHSHLLKGKYPIAAIYLTIDPSLIDVNVHPAKTELRFQYPNEVQSILAIGIRNRIQQSDWASAQHGLREEEDIPTPAPHVEEDVMITPKETKTFSFDHKSNYVPSNLVSSKPQKTFNQEVKRTTTSFQGSTNSSVFSVPPARSMTSMFKSEEVETAKSAMSSDAIPWDELQFVGAFAKCYLLFECNKRMLAIDQHAFHERIIFERLLKDQKILNQVQPLIVPEAIEMAPDEVAKLKERQHEFAKVGINYVCLGESTVEVTHVPSILSNKDLGALLAELANPHAHGSAALMAENLALIPIATIACHSAVRSGEELGEAELKNLLHEAKSVDFYHNCPHGRRVFRWFSYQQIAGWFDR